MISKSEWVDWKADLVTRAFFEAAQTRVEDATEILVSQAGLDPALDSFYRGFIAAYREMRDFTIEDLEDDS